MSVAFHCMTAEALMGQHMPNQTLHMGVNRLHPQEMCGKITRTFAVSDGPTMLQDFSDLVAQKAAQQKRKAAQAKDSGKSKKQKSDTFKF